MAPTVFVPKKSGELRICVDYRSLNKQTAKDFYPFPLPDKVQDRLANASVFSTLDLHSGYWQLPVAEADQPKIAFCLMGLYQFCRMPFGLSGAPVSFQRLMDSVLHGLPFASTYLDDILVYSPNVECHKDHLHQVFCCLQEAGLMLHGKKCSIGVSKVSYLGHIFSADVIQPDPNKVHAVQAWPTPADVAAALLHGTEDDCEEFFPFVLYAYRTTIHFSTNVSPFQLMFGRSPAVISFRTSTNLTLPPMQNTCKPNFKPCKILYVLTWQSPLNNKRDSMTVTLSSVHSTLETLYGCLYPQPESCNHTGMENGLLVN